MTDREGGGTFTLKSSLGHLLYRAQQIAADRFSARLGDLKLTARQFAVLAAVAEAPERSQQDLVEATGIDRSTLADMLKRMEERGLVSRQSAENDRRARAVRLTEAGAARFREAIPLAHAADAALLDALPKKSRDGLAKALMTLTTLPLPENDASAAPDARPEPSIRAETKHKGKRKKDGDKKAAKKSGKGGKAKAGKKSAASALVPARTLEPKKAKRRQGV